MPVSFDAAATASSSASPFSWTHTPVGTPTTVVVGVAIRENLTTVSGITYGGTAMVFVRADLVAAAVRNEVWILDNPPAGAQTITVTLVLAQQTASISVTVTGSATAGQPANHAGATGTSTAPSVTVTSAAGRLVIGFVHVQRNNTDAQITPDAGQTQRASISGPTLNRPRQEATDEAGAASVVTSWTLVTSTSWAAQGVDLSEPAAGVDQRTQVIVILME